MREKYVKRGNLVWALFWWALALGWIYILFYFSGQDAVTSSGISGRLTLGLLRRLPFLNVNEGTFEHILRKLAHFGIFAMEGFLMRVAFYNTKPRKFWNNVFAAIPCCGLAVLNELHQLTADGRACSTRDMVIDSSGALLGIIVAGVLCWMCESMYIRRRYSQMTRKKKKIAFEEDE